MTKSEFKVSRIAGTPIRCDVHGSVVDQMSIVRNGIETVICTYCAANACDHRPWFYTGSPHGREILEAVRK